MNYHFDLVCPRCGKTSEIVSDKRRRWHACGDCLMDHLAIVEMKVVKVSQASATGRALPSRPLRRRAKGGRPAAEPELREYRKLEKQRRK
jgi:NMD protein affecting ribosome stability and mRNA decay